MSFYREDMRRAWERIDSCPTQRLETRFGTIEYVDQGEGVPLLVVHGVLGCHVDTVDGWWASLPGAGFRVIGPSRFGYFGSTLRAGASPADQAEAYAALLDHLGIARAVVIGYSAGSGSVLEFARRRRERAMGLILASCRLGGGVTIPAALKPLLRLAYSADPLFWAFKKLMPTAFSRMMGIPKGYRASPREAEAIAASRELLFPFKPRRDGAVFDGYGSNPVADRFSLRAAGGTHPRHPRQGRPARALPVRRRSGTAHPGSQARDDRGGWPLLHGSRRGGQGGDRRVRPGSDVVAARRRDIVAIVCKTSLPTPAAT